MIYGAISTIIAGYVIVSVYLGITSGKKYLMKENKKEEKIQKIQDKAFQFLGFILVALTVLITQPNATTFSESISLFSLGFMLLVGSVLLTEIKINNFTPYMSEKLNYGSLLCLCGGLLTYLNANKILDILTFAIYFFAVLFVLYFIIMDMRYYTNFFKRIENDRKKK